MNDQKKLTIWEQEYVVKFPNTKELFAISDLRVRLSFDNYNAFRQLDSDGILVSVMVDMISHFTVLIPALKERLNVKELIDLPVEKVVELCYIYMDDFQPWYSGIMNTLAMRPEKKEVEQA